MSLGNLAGLACTSCGCFDPLALQRCLDCFDGSRAFLTSPDLVEGAAVGQLGQEGQGPQGQGEGRGSPGGLCSLRQVGYPLGSFACPVAWRQKVSQASPMPSDVELSAAEVDGEVDEQFNCPGNTGE